MPVMPRISAVPVVVHHVRAAQVRPSGLASVSLGHLAGYSGIVRVASPPPQILQPVLQSGARLLPRSPGTSTSSSPSRRAGGGWSPGTARPVAAQTVVARLGVSEMQQKEQQQQQPQQVQQQAGLPLGAVQVRPGVYAVGTGGSGSPVLRSSSPQPAGLQMGPGVAASPSFRRQVVVPSLGPNSQMQRAGDPVAPTFGRGTGPPRQAAPQVVVLGGGAMVPKEVTDGLCRSMPNGMVTALATSPIPSFVAARPSAMVAAGSGVVPGVPFVAQSHPATAPLMTDPLSRSCSMQSPAVRAIVAGSTSASYVHPPPRGQPLQTAPRVMGASYVAAPPRASGSFTLASRGYTPRSAVIPMSAMAQRMPVATFVATAPQYASVTTAVQPGQPKSPPLVYRR